MTFVQRFGSALNLNVHFYSLVLDGVYEELERVVRSVVRGIARLREGRRATESDRPRKGKQAYTPGS